MAPALVDGAGKGSWDIMLRRIELLFQAGEDGLNGEVSLQPRYGLRRFLHRLAQWQEEGEKKLKKREVVIVSHSMGTIIANRILRLDDSKVCPDESDSNAKAEAEDKPKDETASTMDGETPAADESAAATNASVRKVAKAPRTKPCGCHANGRMPGNSIPRIKHIVYMAAAATIDDYEASVFPYLQRHRCAKFYALTLHEKAENGEVVAVGLAPRGSLLVWIDKFLASPGSARGMTSGRYKNLLPAVHHIPNEIRDRVHIRVFGFGGDDPDEPQSHGQFKNRFTQGNFWNEHFWAPDPSAEPCSPW